MIPLRLREWLSNRRGRTRTPAKPKNSPVGPDQQAVEPVGSRSKQLVAEIKDWQLTHGFLMKLVRLEEPTTVLSRPINVSVLPTPFSKSLFEEAQSLQTIYNELYLRAASDPDWLFNVLGGILDSDNLAISLWSIHQAVVTAGSVQNVVCGIFRSDYMVDQSPSQGVHTLKQIEINTFSVAGACHAERAANMHKHLQRAHQSYSNPAEEIYMPSSNNTQALVKVLQQAHLAYEPATCRQICVLMIVQPHNFNIADERPIEYGLWDEGVRCYRCTWQEVLIRTQLEADRTLSFRENDTMLEVSAVYYRAGYEAKEYDAGGRQTRLQLELSRAIKCPDVLTHMTTFKAVQAALTAPGAVERFLSADQAQRITETFVLNLRLDDLEAYRIALDPVEVTGYVLKPNREGGGHGMYGAYIPGYLSTLPKAQHGNYILMALVRPPEQIGALLSWTEFYQGAVVSELGMIGTCLWERNSSGIGISKLLANTNAGWTFKTKPAHVQEMNVVKGNGCFDCPRLK